MRWIACRASRRWSPLGGRPLRPDHSRQLPTQSRAPVAKRPVRACACACACGEDTEGRAHSLKRARIAAWRGAVAVKRDGRTSVPVRGNYASKGRYSLVDLDVLLFLLLLRSALLSHVGNDANLGRAAPGCGARMDEGVGSTRPTNHSVDTLPPLNPSPPLSCLVCDPPPVRPQWQV